ncbi:MAG: aldehyde ferredoxin oxidoreductase C-terminal domain-containing protein, partial [Candidatus Thermoplasmatota archaeon]|nr:aldehyde ferredoxin oxidoreductase C-terminal domain-containing protein [Candidatus Thermoplasmatota archaeon]
VDYVNVITDWNWDMQKLLETGERIQTQRQLFNIREGIDVASVPISKRAIGIPPLERGPNKGITVDLEKMRKSYFVEMGWDENGHPKKGQLERLGIKPY